MERLIRTALANSDQQFCEACLRRLTPEGRAQLDELLNTTSEAPTSAVPEAALGRSTLYELKLDPGRVSLDTIQSEIAKLERLRQCGLPDDLFQGVSPKILESYRQRGMAEELHEIKRHPEALRYTLLAAFCWTRQQEIMDTLVELLIDTVQHIKKRAEERVTKIFLADIRRVSGKDEMLVKLSEAALAQPDGIVHKVLYPVVGEETLRAIVTLPSR